MGIGVTRLCRIYNDVLLTAAMLAAFLFMQDCRQFWVAFCDISGRDYQIGKEDGRMEVGRLTKIAVRELWPDEAQDFMFSVI